MGDRNLYKYCLCNKQKYYDIIKAAIDTFAPERTKTVTIRHRNIWFTEEVQKQKRIVQKCDKTWRQHRKRHQWQTFKCEQRRYNNLLKATKTELLSAEINACKGDTKELYKVFNNITGKKAENPMPVGKSDQDLADDFADFFMAKICQIRDCLSDFPKYIPTDRNVTHFNTFHTVSQEHVSKTIMSMATKSCELDSMPAHLLKKILPTVLPAITTIINASLEKGMFVDQWKLAIIRPTLKKLGLELTLSNYRPVSNLSFLSKVLEKVVLEQFMNHCTLYNLMPSYQSAYRRNFSCETALVKLVNDLLWVMEDQHVAALMALDLSAAFDTVDHDILLSVLKSQYGITGHALSWFDSYLRPRKCKVNVGSSYSKEKDLTFSVPQGSCLGPVLYLAYAGTLSEIIPSDIEIHGYADDHAVKLSFPADDRNKERRAISQLEDCALEINNWMHKNRLKMNPSKAEFIMFGASRQLPKCNTSSITVSGNTVERSVKIKYLGVTLDEHLSLKEHVMQKCKSAMWNLQKIKHVRSVLTKEACETLMLGLVITQLDYANALYIALPECHLQRLQRVQNIAAKIVLNDGDSSRSSLKRLHWLPVRQRIKHKVLTLVYKCLNDTAPSYLKDLLHPQTHRRSGLRSGDTNLLSVPFVRRKTFADRSISIAGPKWWNSLPHNIREAPNENTFKKTLKTFLYDEF